MKMHLVVDLYAEQTSNEVERTSFPSTVAFIWLPVHAIKMRQTSPSLVCWKTATIAENSTVSMLLVLWDEISPGLRADTNTWPSNFVSYPCQHLLYRCRHSTWLHNWAPIFWKPSFWMKIGFGDWAINCVRRKASRGVGLLKTLWSVRLILTKNKLTPQNL